MPSFSERSTERLRTCDPDLFDLFQRVVETFDVTIICGHRGEEDQDRAVAKGASKLAWPRSKHNKTPSLAVDVAPWPLDWNARDRFILLGGFVLGIAEEMGIDIRWGGDWNDNRFMRDERLQDLVHFELTGDH
jgi:hypothetical protein